MARFYRPRDPRSTPLWSLLESRYEELAGVWDDRFEARYAFWRGGLTDAAVAKYLDCGVPEAGFARLRCDGCAAERLLTFSCRTRSFCPSCGAKRAAVFAAFLHDEVLEPVGHAQWVFTIPKILRPYFLHHRELMGSLARAAWETVRDLMAAATGDPTLRPGVVVVPQSFGSAVNFHPHIHAIASRGGRNAEGEWVPVPFVDPIAAARLFRHKVLRFLKRADLVDEDRVRLILGWKLARLLRPQRRPRRARRRSGSRAPRQIPQCGRPSPSSGSSGTATSASSPTTPRPATETRPRASSASTSLRQARLPRPSRRSAPSAPQAPDPLLRLLLGRQPRPPTQRRKRPRGGPRCRDRA